jgi:hypothetical protein
VAVSGRLTDPARPEAEPERIEPFDVTKGASS